MYLNIFSDLLVFCSKEFFSSHVRGITVSIECEQIPEWTDIYNVTTLSVSHAFLSQSHAERPCHQSTLSVSHEFLSQSHAETPCHQSTLLLSHAFLSQSHAERPCHQSTYKISPRVTLASDHLRELDLVIDCLGRARGVTPTTCHIYVNSSWRICVASLH